MSDQESLDISKVVSLIMENPALIEQISNLAKTSKGDAESQPEAQAEVSQIPTPPIEMTEPTIGSPTYSSGSFQRSNRAQLLGALKPYVSKERARAIDSMISIADVLDMMKTR